MHSHGSCDLCLRLHASLLPPPPAYLPCCHRHRAAQLMTPLPVPGAGEQGELQVPFQFYLPNKVPPTFHYHSAEFEAQ